MDVEASSQLHRIKNKETLVFHFFHVTKLSRLYIENRNLMSGPGTSEGSYLIICPQANRENPDLTQKLHNLGLLCLQKR